MKSSQRRRQPLAPPTHLFNGPLSGTTQVGRYQKVKPIWVLLKQETVSGSGISWAICKSAPRSRQITMPAPHHSSFLQAGCPSCRPTNRVKALKALEHSSRHIPESDFFLISAIALIHNQFICMKKISTGSLSGVWVLFSMHTFYSLCLTVCKTTLKLTMNAVNVRTGWIPLKKPHHAFSVLSQLSSIPPYHVIFLTTPSTALTLCTNQLMPVYCV